MKKIILSVVALLFVSGAALAAEHDIAKVNVFLSNFTEIGMYEIEADELFTPEGLPDAVRFGIWHNYINNYKSRIAPCKTKNCEHGSLTIDGKYVNETLQKYFGRKLDKLVSVQESDPPYYYDGKLYHFEGADGEAAYHARVTQLSPAVDGVYTLTGEIFNVEDSNDVMTHFVAKFKEHKWNGKDTYKLISLHTAD